MSVRNLLPIGLALVATYGCANLFNSALKTYEDEVDFSTASDGSEAAIINGSWGEVLAVSWDCWIAYRGQHAKRIIIDPGQTLFRAVCEVWDLGGDVMRDSIFSIDAKAGREYRVNRLGATCIKVTDQSTGEVVAEGWGCSDD